MDMEAILTSPTGAGETGLDRRDSGRYPLAEHRRRLRVPTREWARDLGIRAAGATRSGSFDARPATGPIDVIDLFSGCGGLSTGFEVVGRLTPSFRLAGAADLDPHGCATYAANLPVTPAE